MPLRSDPDKLRAWQNRSRSNLARKTGLRQRSPSKKDRRRAVAEACAVALARDWWRCQAESLVPSVRCGGPIDPHHLWPRLVSPSHVVDPAAILACCRRHHEFIDANPAEANRLGLHAFTGDTLDELALRRLQSAPDRPLRASEGPQWGSGLEGS